MKKTTVPVDIKVSTDEQDIDTLKVHGAIRQQFRRLLKKERSLARQQARVRKAIEREAYEWSALGH